MPADALPHWGPAAAGRVELRRQYHDALRRPMTGEVTITGGRRTTDGDSVVIPAAVVVRLEQGLLLTHLPPGTYTLVAALKTQDGSKATDVETVVLGEA